MVSSRPGKVVETVEDGRGEACDGVFEGCGRSWEREQNGALGGSRRAVAASKRAV